MAALAIALRDSIEVSGIPVVERNDEDDAASTAEK
jgi:hypothetical protein